MERSCVLKGVISKDLRNIRRYKLQYLMSNDTYDKTACKRQFFGNK